MKDYTESVWIFAIPLLAVAFALILLMGAK